MALDAIAFLLYKFLDLATLWLLSALNVLAAFSPA
jgi:hypothetical protein